MTEDKILAYLNLKKEQKIDKSLMKIVLWFDLSFTMIIMIFGLLLHIFRFDFLDYIYFFGCIVTVALFAFWCKKAVRPTAEISFSVFVLFVSTIKLFYAYLSFSNIEAIVYGYPRFSWFHLIVLVGFMLIAFYMWWRFYQIFRDLKTYTIEQARKNIEKKQMRFLWIPIILGSPMILVRLTRDSMANVKLGVGFCLWSLSCIWLCLCLILLPKYIVIKKYKVANILLDTGDDTGDDSPS